MTTPEQNAVAAAARSADLVASRAGARPTIASIWQALARVPDPEIPVVSIVELGIVRDVAWQDNRLRVTVTPTYSGCPATELIVKDIGEALRNAGVAEFDVATALSPAWTTDWIAPEGKAKLAAFGIAPPGPVPVRVDVKGISVLRRARVAIACPRCGSTRTALLAQFGSTACKALYRCEECREPFDHFKPF